TRFSRDWSSDVCSSDLCRLTPHINAVDRAESGVAGGQRGVRVDPVPACRPVEEGLARGGAHRYLGPPAAICQRHNKAVGMVEGRSEERRVGKGGKRG